jgi:D-3-phosphoglycerate dehydrogenase
MASKPKVLLYEPMHEEGMKVLYAHAEPYIASACDEETIIREGQEADAMIIRALGSVSARIMDACPRLKVVGRHGIGVDNVDVQAATERGIWVVNTPTTVTEPVAEHVVGMIIAVIKDFRRCDQSVRAGDWKFRDSVEGINLLGRTIGMVGMGRIGYRTAEICHKGLGMNILYHDVRPSPRAEAELGARRLDLLPLLEQSDIVSLHTPYLPETHHLINAEALAHMKPSAILVNASRGKVVDEAALVEALKAKRIRAAALDVFEQEPPAKDNPLFQLDNVFLTPHVASSTTEALIGMSLVAEDVVALLEGRTPQFPVNHPPHPRI